MNFKLHFLAAALLLEAGTVAAQGDGPTHPGYQRAHEHSAHPATYYQPTGSAAIADANEDKYDVKYVKLNLTMQHDTTALGGDVTTVALVNVPALAVYAFELDTLLTIDSVLLDGVARPVTTSGFVRKATFGTPVARGALFTAQVFYHGSPKSGTRFGAKGINSLRSPSWGTKATFTLSEPYYAREWWPCKQSLTDKIDSADIWLTVDDSLKAGSNGLLQATTPIGTNQVRYEWKNRYPIDYYLISAAVAPYVDYSFYMHFSGSSDSMLVQNYVYNNPLTLAFFKDVIDSTAMQIDYFSQLFGRYPFWQEKYGHCMGALSGGMEHQTMSTMGYFEGWLVAHELGHQWFGDNVTCRTWKDIFVNEGFASYCEYLFYDHFNSRTAATADIVDRQDFVMSEWGGSIFVDDTASSSRIFDSRLSYNKGACVLHMLRYIINNDSVFFQAIKDYQHDLKDSTGTVADFGNTVIRVAGPVVNGINLTTFFQQWIYLQGFPIYDVRWNQSGNNIFVNLAQTTSMPSSVSCFTLPIEVRLRSATGDTVIRVVNDRNAQSYQFKWGKTVTSLAIDPNNWVVDSLTDITRDISLQLHTATTTAATIHPNPTKGNWTIATTASNTHLLLTDIAGKTIWQGTLAQPGTGTIPANGLPAGIYLLRTQDVDGQLHTYKLVKE